MLQEPTFLILTALADQPRHGYGVIQEVARLSDGRVNLRPGTLYGSIDRLVEQGHVMADGEEVVDGRLRRYYRITDAGARLLADQAEQLAANAAMAIDRLSGGGWRPAPAQAPASGVA